MNTTIRTRTAVIGATLIAGLMGSLLAGTPAQAAQPAVNWGGEGYAEIPVGPLSVDLELVDFSSPAEITRRQTVDVDVSITGPSICSSSLAAIPLRDGVPLVAGVPLGDVDDYYSDTNTVSIPVDAAGTYSLRIEGTYNQGDSCYYGPQATVPFETVIDLFAFSEDLPGPASTAKVQISSTGPHTLVANTYGKSSPIPIKFMIKDPQKRRDLRYSMCMGDAYDCWFEDALLKPTSSTKKTSTGWTKSWNFWWKRTSPSDCLTYYWQQPDVSVIMIVRNRDGQFLGRKKHTVKLTCRR